MAKNEVYRHAKGFFGRVSFVECASHTQNLRKTLSRYHYHNYNVIQYGTDLSAVSQGPVANQ